MNNNYFIVVENAFLCCIIQQLKDDDGLKEAVKILNDPVKYKEMLSAPVAKK